MSISPDFFSKADVNAILSNRKNDLICLKEDATVEDALSILSKHFILSAPVQELETGRCLGFVDVFDILSYALQNYTEDDEGTVQMNKLYEYCAQIFQDEDEDAPDPVTPEELKKKEAEMNKAVEMWCNNMTTLSVRGAKLAQDPVENLIDKSGMDPLFTIDAGSNLKDILEIFSDRVHRVAVTDPKTEVAQNVVCQSDVIKYINSHIDHLGTAGKMTMQEIVNTIAESSEKKKRKIFTISSNTKAVDAFFRILLFQVSALAVVNDEGELVTQLSGSDLKGLTAETFPDLLLPIMEYLAKHGSKGKVLKSDYSFTLADAIQKLVQQRSHRIWIVQDKKPVNLISLTDIAKLLIKLRGNE